MSDQGKLYYERGIRYFELEHYEQAVIDLIRAYELGYEKKRIIDDLYQCFVYPNEQEFQDNFNKNSSEFTKLDYNACTLDFIPVTNEKFYIFDREEKNFQGVFAIDDKPIRGRKPNLNSILYTDIWDIREILPDMQEYSRITFYIVLNELEAKFASFFKLPHFKQIYCSFLVVFKNDFYMQSFFSEYEEFYLPKIIKSTHAQKYVDMIHTIHQNRISLDRSKKQDRKNIFLSICLPSYNCGTSALKKVEYLLNCPCDSEIEIVISNNASTEDIQGYEKIEKIKDTRIKYFEFTKHQNKNINILKTLELSQGMFAVLVDDEYILNLEHFLEYFNDLKAYENCGVIVTLNNNCNMKKLYNMGTSAIDMASNLNIINGLAFNMMKYSAINIHNTLKKIQDNAFVKDYVHVCIAMLLSKISDLAVLDVNLIINISNETNSEKRNEILSYMWPENRIDQQNGFMNFYKEYFEVDKDEFIIKFLNRCGKTYFLLQMAYDAIDGFVQFGEKKDVYYQVYLEQKKYLDTFPCALSDTEYQNIKNELKKIGNSALRQGTECLIRLQTNELKYEILSTMKDRHKIGKLKQLIQSYEEEYPKDLDLYIIKAWYWFIIGDTEKAYFIIKDGIRRNPFNFDLNQAARFICKHTKRFAEAYRYDTTLMVLKQYYGELPDIDSWKDELLNELNKMIQEFQERGDLNQAAEYLKELNYIEKHFEKGFGFDDQAYYEYGAKMITVGTIYEDMFENRKYNASYYTQDAGDLIVDMRSVFYNWLFTKLECIEVEKMNQMQLGNEGEYLLPVLQEDNSKLYTFILPDCREFVCHNLKAQHFEYYRLPSATQLLSEEPLYIGHPIKLKQAPGKKKLVLNIFVDGISQKVIEEENFADLMPFTYKFFSKGVHCSNVYTAAEWTLPSLATYVSGMSSIKHMIIHNGMTNIFSTDYTILAEYFKEQGYYTAKIDGDWRSTQSYGYGRGMDRIIYQHQYVGMNAEQVVQDVLDHIKLMKDTNQFVWMCVGDLHMIADEIPLRQSVQADIPLEYRTVDRGGISSVKQKYSKSKRDQYMRQMKYIDEYLEVLYRYIEENYSNEDIIVSLFGDHGQGFLVEEGKHFLSEGRSKVAMMFRSGEARNTIVMRFCLLVIICLLCVNLRGYL